MGNIYVFNCLNELKVGYWVSSGVLYGMKVLYYGFLLSDNVITIRIFYL